MTLGFIFIILTITAAFALLASIFFADEIKSTMERDPAAGGYLQVILLYAGLHAVIFHRINHRLWQMKLRFVARLFSQVARIITGIEIHPGAQIGKGLFIDHGTGVVVGETAIVGNNVTLFQGVTLGGTGKECGKRHPTIGDNVIIGAGAKVLGNITVNDNSYIGANAVILKDVPKSATVVGVPGRIARHKGKKVDIMDHAQVSDPIMRHMRDLIKRVKHLEDRIPD
ncbi:MAG: serine O-acetyltransferase, partial [Lysobacterales bacterium]